MAAINAGNDLTSDVCSPLTIEFADPANGARMPITVSLIVRVKLSQLFALSRKWRWRAAAPAEHCLRFSVLDLPA